MTATTTTTTSRVTQAMTTSPTTTPTKQGSLSSRCSNGPVTSWWKAQRQRRTAEENGLEGSQDDRDDADEMDDDDRGFEGGELPSPVCSAPPTSASALSIM